MFSPQSPATRIGKSSSMAKGPDKKLKLHRSCRMVPVWLLGHSALPATTGQPKYGTSNIPKCSTAPQSRNDHSCESCGHLYIRMALGNSAQPGAGHCTLAQHASMGPCFSYIVLHLSALSRREPPKPARGTCAPHRTCQKSQHFHTSGRRSQHV